MHKFFYLLLILILILLLPVYIFAKDTIALLTPVSFEGTEDQRSIVTEILKRAAALTNRIYDTYIEVKYSENAGSADYIVEPIFSFEGERSYTLVTMKNKKGERSPSLNLTAEITMTTSSYVANTIFSLWSSYHGYCTHMMKQPPAFVEELSTVEIGKSIMHDYPSLQQLSPQSLVVKKNGYVLAGFNWACVEMDTYLRILDQPGRILYEEGNNFYAYGVGVTPGGTIYFKPSMGREIIRIVEGLPRPQKWKAGTDLNGPFTVLPDGSVILINTSDKKAYRIEEKKRTELTLCASPYSYISALTVGPEGNIWLYDVVERRVNVFSPQGEYITGIMPIVDDKTFLNPFSIAVYNDQSFILSNLGELWCFRKDGTPYWKLTEIPGPVTDKLPQIFYFTLDPSRGIIYLADSIGKRILKFCDVSYCEERNISNTFEEKIITLNREYWKDDSDPEPLVKKALLYEEKGAFECAKGIWELILNEDPFHEKAALHLESMELMILKQSAKEMKAKTLETLATMGPASAKTLYNQTLVLYERILRLNPDEEGIHDEVEELKKKYTEKEKTADVKTLLISVGRVKIQNLFPSLMHYYRNNPAGEVTIKNTLPHNITDVTASLYIMRYMDLPTETKPVALVKPGEAVTMHLFVEFNQEIFELEEDLPKQARVDITYKVNGSKQGVSKTKGLTIYRRTALYWDDSGKLASFIMPNDEIISNFSHRIIGTDDLTKSYRLSKKFFRAMRVCDGLGTYGITYVEDPESPLSYALGKERVIDTVRFPRNTLMIKSGDCDDSTALLGSLLESAGIGTAIMTSPGHVFLAFNTEEPEENLWQFETAQLKGIAQHGTVWIPVETTALKEGFRTAWQQASEIIKKYQGSGKLEFLSVISLRDTYPALPLPKSSYLIVEPQYEDIDSRYKKSVTHVVADIYETTLSGIEMSLKAARGRKKAKLLNEIGCLHARFGNEKEAEKTFNLCMEEFPDFSASFVNCANIKVENRKVDEAILILKKGIKKNPDSVFMNLLLARCYYMKGNQKETTKYLAVVKERSPELAERYAYLEAGRQTRAGAETDEPPFIWIEEE
jgi:tetratricopeptide (TPR) repeat protein